MLACYMIAADTIYTHTHTHIPVYMFHPDAKLVQLLNWMLVNQSDVWLIDQASGSITGQVQHPDRTYMAPRYIWIQSVLRVSFLTSKVLGFRPGYRNTAVLQRPLFMFWHICPSVKPLSG